MYQWPWCEDPLRDDADAGALWDKFRKLRKSVGLALMDQSVIAGVGNIYRAEICYKAGIHTLLIHPQYTPTTSLIRPLYTPYAPLLHPFYTPNAPLIHP